MAITPIKNAAEIQSLLVNAAPAISLEPGGQTDVKAQQLTDGIEGTMSHHASKKTVFLYQGTWNNN